MQANFTTLNEAAKIEAKEKALKAAGRDSIGRFTESTKLVSKAKAWKKLEASSRKANRAMAMLDELEA